MEKVANPVFFGTISASKRGSRIGKERHQAIFLALNEPFETAAE